MEPHYLNAQLLFGAAKLARDRASDKSAPVTIRSADAIAAVVFAACTLEALISELGLLSGVLATTADSPVYHRAVADILEEVEESRGSVRLKYLLAKALTPGPPFDKANQPYQDLHLLFSLRDAIVHMKPSPATLSPHKLHTALRSKGLCPPPDPATVTNWVSEIATENLATWACSVVAAVAQAFSVPFATEEVHAPTRALLGDFWAKNFQDLSSPSGKS